MRLTKKQAEINSIRSLFGSFGISRPCAGRSIPNYRGNFYILSPTNFYDRRGSLSVMRRALIMSNSSVFISGAAAAESGAAAEKKWRCGWRCGSFHSVFVSRIRLSIGVWGWTRKIRAPKAQGAKRQEAGAKRQVLVPEGRVIEG